MKLRDVILLLLMSIFFTGCGEGYRYHRLMEKELARGVRYDSIFLGIYLGMPKNDFYTLCWNLNRKGLVRQGSGNTTVYYKMNGMKDTVEVNFYPNFHKDTVWRLPVKYNYISWAPWNKELFADTLEMELLKKYTGRYGNGFHKVLNGDREPSYYKIDGNRLITIFKGDDRVVWTVFTDLNILKKINKLRKSETDSTATGPFMF